jgi:hypothetical protein
MTGLLRHARITAHRSRRAFGSNVKHGAQAR